MSSYIEDLLTRAEGKTLEFKQDVSAARNILRTVTAFANTAGGVVLIGVADDSRAVLGVENPRDEEERLCNLISDSIAPRLAPNVQIVNWKGRTLLLIEVYPSAQRPHWLRAMGMENGAFVRVGSTNRQADAPLRAEMQRSALNLSYDEQPMPDINPDKLDIRVASGLFAGLHEWNENTAENLNLLTRHQGRVVPTIGGVLLFGTVRERYFSDAWIQCGRFRGTNKVSILDQQDVRDHLPLALERAFDFVKKHAMCSAEFGDLRRKDVWNVPLEGIREALTNAIVHADYSQIGSPIRVAIFDDRIEVENPGLLMSGMTIDNIREGVSMLRNRVIGRVFKELDLIEQWGSGFQRMVDSCQAINLPEPVFEELGYHFRVIFSLLRQSESVENPIDLQILECLARYEVEGGASMKQLVEWTGLVDRSVRRHLARLIKAGQIVAIGKSTYDPNKRYLPAKKER